MSLEIEYQHLIQSQRAIINKKKYNLNPQPCKILKNSNKILSIIKLSSRRNYKQLYKQNKSTINVRFYAELYAKYLFQYSR